MNVIIVCSAWDTLASAACAKASKHARGSSWSTLGPSGEYARGTLLGAGIDLVAISRDKFKGFTFYLGCAIERLQMV